MKENKVTFVVWADFKWAFGRADQIPSYDK